MVTKRVTVKNPALTEDQEVMVPGLGLFKNNETREVTDEQVELFEAEGFKFPEDGHLILEPPDRTPPPEDTAEPSSEPLIIDNTEGDEA